MSQDINRLLMALERSMREINREVINPEIPALTLDDLRPVLHRVAKARASYLKALLDLGARADHAQAVAGELDELARLRREYEELASAAKALETAIQRGYLDIRVDGG
ncbi:MAG: hypothetical protein WBN68_06605 [Sedimenticolaceae bacterium]